MLVIIEYNNIKPVICFTKYDLLDDKKEIDETISYYKSIGYDVFINDSIEDIKSILKGKVSVLTGQTGVGKSSLLNKFKEDLNLPTGEISKALGRGRHTTRHVEIFPLSDGTMMYDTPGFTSLDMPDMEPIAVRDLFPEFRSRNGMCRYSDCMHINEPECAVKEALQQGLISVSRYESYKSMIEEVKKWQK
jgi:ribosome biogenesis GTPase